MCTISNTKPINVVIDRSVTIETALFVVNRYYAVNAGRSGAQYWTITDNADILVRNVIHRLLSSGLAKVLLALAGHGILIKPMTDDLKRIDTAWRSALFTRIVQ